MRRLSAVLVIAIAACTEPGENAAFCQQTNEFGNFGCTRVLAVAAPPDGDLPVARRLSVVVRPVRDVEAVGDYARYGGFAPVTVELTRWFDTPSTRDTVSAWVVAKLLDQTTIAAGPLPVIAADSALRVLRMGRVGQLAPVDTVPLTLKRP